MLLKNNRITGLLLLFCAAGLLLFSPLFYDMYQLPKALAALITVFMTAIFMVFSKENSRMGLPGIFLSLFCLYAAFLILFTPNHPPLYYAALFFSPLLFYTAYYSKVRTDTFAGFINILLLASLIYGLYQFFILKNGRPYSFFGNPIFFAEFIGFTLPFALYTIVTNGRMLVPAFLCVLLSMPALVAASSRGPVISAVISISILVAYYARSSAGSRLKIPAIALLIAIICLPFATPDFLSSLKNAGTRASNLFSIQNPEIQNRLNLASCGVEIFKDAPFFGAGPGAVKKYQQLKQSVILKNRADYRFVNSSYVHNDYIQLMAETGLFGLFLYLAFIFSLAYMFEKISPLMDLKPFLFCISLFSSVIFILAESFFNFPLFSFPSSALLFISAGLIARECLPYKQAGPSLPGIYIKIFAVLIIIAILSYSFIIKPGAVASNFYLKEALKADFGGKQNPPILYEKAVALEKDSYFALFHYAQYLALREEYQASLQRYTQLLALFPYSADIMYNRGNIHLARGMYADALDGFDEALFYYPGFAMAHMGAYKALMKLGQEEKANRHLEAAAMADKSVLNNNSGSKVVFFEEVTGSEK